MKPFGSIKGKQNLSSVTSTSGLWNIEDHHSLRQGGAWPVNTVANPQELRAQNITTDGSYYIRAATSGQTQNRLLYVKFNMVDSKDWVLVFQAPNRGTATVNELGYSIPWKGLCLETPGGTFYYSYYTSYKLFNTRGNDTQGETTTGGNRSGYRTYLGGGGAHGFYNTAQGTCSWGDSNGAVGAGWDGTTCGTWPNGLIMGTGNSGTPNYSEQSGTWKTWIWMDTAT